MKKINGNIPNVYKTEANLVRNRRFTMWLRCKGCGSTNTKVISAHKLSETTNDTSFLQQSAGTIDPILIVKIIMMFFDALGKVFSWLEEKEKGNRKVVVCEDCGYWEKI